MIKFYSARAKNVAEYVAERLAHLSYNYRYHDLVHTWDVLDVATDLAKREGLSDKEIELVQVAALFHDIGYLYRFKANEDLGMAEARGYLSAEGFKHHEITLVCGMIHATQIPQKPGNIYDQILCDADVANFGRGDFFQKGILYRAEIKAYDKETYKDNNLDTDLGWYKYTLDFLEMMKNCGTFYTKSGKILYQVEFEGNIRKLRSYVRYFEKEAA